MNEKVGWRKLQNEEIHSSRCSSNMVGMSIFSKLKQHVAKMYEGKSFKILRKKCLERAKKVGENISFDIK